MSDERKRIIEQTASTEIFDDDWFIKDSALHNTTKISQTVLKQEILKDVKGVVELTQAEYDALPSSKLTDGILYAIKDSEDIIGNIENAINTLSGDIDDLEELVSTEMYNTAPMWSDASYTFDDLVVYGIDGRLYRCIVRNSTANQFVPAEWQATDIKSELYLLLQQIAPQFIASSQSYTQVYYKGNLVLHTNYYGVNTFYVCKQDLPQGDTEWVENHWEEVNTVSGLSKYLMDKIAEAGQIDDVQVKTTGDYESVVDENKVAKIDLSNMLIEKSVPNLPQSVATFNDGSDLPLKSLTASIVPVQDLHGYDSPWVGGAGKNKWGEGISTTPDVSGLYGGWYIPYNSKATLKLFDKGTTVDLTGVYLGMSDDGTSAPVGWLIDNGTATSSGKFTSTSFHYVTIYPNNAQTLEKIFAKYNVMCVVDEADETTFAPYSNICPISGWTEEVVKNTGANLIGGDLFANAVKNAMPSATIDEAEKTVSFVSSAALDNYIVVDDRTYGDYYIPFKENTSYTFVLTGYNSKTTTAASNLRIYYTDGTNTTLSFDSTSATKQTKIYTTPASKTVDRLSKTNQDGTTVLYYDECGIFEGTITAEEYEPYAGTTTTIPFTDGQGQSVEVFGGSVDVVNGGENPSILKKIDLGELEWTPVNLSETSRSEGLFVTQSLTDNVNFDSFSLVANIISSQYLAYPSYKYISPSRNPSIGIAQYEKNIYVSDPNLANKTDAEVKTALNGVQLVYELATPTTFYTQPTSIKSLDGVNNVFASTGDVDELKYIANATDVIANLEARVTALENQ